MPSRPTIRIAVALCLVIALLGQAPSASAAAPIAVDIATRGGATWILRADGSVSVSGGAGHVGDVSGWKLNGAPLAIEATPSGNGYWIVGADGGIFTFGDAGFHGSTGNLRLNAPIIDMAATPTGNGYWLLASDGGIFTFGDAAFHGSTGNLRLNAPIIDMAATPTGNGYWLLGADGGIFTFGDAAFHGSTGNLRLNAPIIDMAATPTGNGYWLLGADGGIFTFGDAAFHGSAVGRGVAVAIEPTATGYQVMTASGETIDFTDTTPPDPEPAIGEVTRVNVSSAGEQGAAPGPSTGAVSADGRYVAFDSGSANLVPGDTNGADDVFVHDVHTGETTRVSVSSDGTQGNAPSSRVSISGDGRFVAFDSDASNLVALDANGLRDVFLHDRQTGTTTLVSVASDGTQTDRDSIWPSISADGTRIAFMSWATTLAGRDSVDPAVYLRDTTTGITELVSTNGDPDAASNSVFPSISADGRVVVWLEQDGTELIPGIFATEVLIKDTQTGVLSAARPDNIGDEHRVSVPCVSADGRYVSYSLAEGPGTDPGRPIRYDRLTNTTVDLAISLSGGPANGQHSGGPLSDDGRFFAFTSDATDLVAGDTNGTRDVFVRDVDAGTTQRVSVSSAGVEGNGDSDDWRISGDGRYVVFVSAATNLVAGDTNGVNDVFLVRLR